MKSASLSEMIPTPEAASVLGVSVAHLETQRVRPGQRPIPFYKIGRLVRYKRSELLEIIEAGRRLSTSDPGPADAV
ncbi:MAG: helix-turn-helix domain-containing protein [Gammaproteobacteria bacterium]|nr:helix-turn-helix domain-containing protein [Gammaproteobacteria bacterium]